MSYLTDLINRARSDVQATAYPVTTNTTPTTTGRSSTPVYATSTTVAPSMPSTGDESSPYFIGPRYIPPVEVPDWAKQQVEVPQGIAAAGFTEQYQRLAYEQYLGTKTSEQVQSELNTLLSSNRLYMENYAPWGEEGKTLKEIQRSEPALVLVENKYTGAWEPSYDYVSWGKSREKAGGVVLTALKDIGAGTLSAFDPSYWSAGIRGEGQEYIYKQEYEDYIKIQQGRGLEVWGGRQIPAYTNIIIPLAGGAVIGKAIGAVGAAGTTLTGAAATATTPAIAGTATTMGGMALGTTMGYFPFVAGGIFSGVALSSNITTAQFEAAGRLPEGSTLSSVIGTGMQFGAGYAGYKLTGYNITRYGLTERPSFWGNVGQKPGRLNDWLYKGTETKPGAIERFGAWEGKAKTAYANVESNVLQPLGTKMGLDYIRSGMGEVKMMGAETRFNQPSSARAYMYGEQPSFTSRISSGLRTFAQDRGLIDNIGNVKGMPDYAAESFGEYGYKTTYTMPAEGWARTPGETLFGKRPQIYEYESYAGYTPTSLEVHQANIAQSKYLLSHQRATPKSVEVKYSQIEKIGPNKVSFELLLNDEHTHITGTAETILTKGDVSYSQYEAVFEKYKAVQSKELANDILGTKDVESVPLYREKLGGVIRSEKIGDIALTTEGITEQITLTKDVSLGWRGFSKEPTGSSGMTQYYTLGGKQEYTSVGKSLYDYQGLSNKNIWALESDIVVESDLLTGSFQKSVPYKAYGEISDLTGGKEYLPSHIGGSGTKSSISLQSALMQSLQTQATDILGNMKTGSMQEAGGLSAFESGGGTKTPITQFEWYQAPLADVVYAPQPTFASGGFASLTSYLPKADTSLLSTGMEYPLNSRRKILLNLESQEIISPYWEDVRPKIDANIPSLTGGIERLGVSQIGGQRIGELRSQNIGTADIYNVGERTDIFTRQKLGELGILGSRGQTIGELQETRMGMFNVQLTSPLSISREEQKQITRVMPAQVQKQALGLQQMSITELITPLELIPPIVPPPPIPTETPPPPPPTIFGFEEPVPPKEPSIFTPLPTPLISKGETEPRGRGIGSDFGWAEGKRGKQEKGILADLLSVTKSQARFGTATHPHATKEAFRLGEQSMFMRVPTEELREGRIPSKPLLDIFGNTSSKPVELVGKRSSGLLGKMKHIKFTSKPKERKNKGGKKGYDSIY